MSNKTKIYIDLMTILGNNIEIIRRTRWLSQSQLAKKAKITQSMVSNIEDWEYNPTLDVINKIATALKVSPSFLFKNKLDWDMVDIIENDIFKFGFNSKSKDA